MELLAHCLSSPTVDGMQLHINVLCVLPDPVFCMAGALPLTIRCGSFLGFCRTISYVAGAQIEQQAKLHRTSMHVVL